MNVIMGSVNKSQNECQFAYEIDTHFLLVWVEITKTE